MSALINVTEEVSRSLQNNIKESNKEFVSLLKQKIEDCIMEDRPIIINISDDLIMECRNTFFIDDYEVNEEFLYLNNGNFELHINLKESKVNYDDTLAEITFINNDTEIKLYFE